MTGMAGASSLPRARIAAAAAVLSAIMLAGGCGRSAAQQPSSDVSTDSVTGFAGAAIPAPQRHPFSLTDLQGRRVSLATVRGQVTVLAFLSSHCGAPCILIAQQIRGAIDELPRPVPVLLVSVDPAADTPARVAAFLAQVSLTGHARFLSGSTAQLQPLWRAYRIPPASAGRAAFEQSAPVALLDGAGRERVVYGLELLTPEALAHDIRRLQAQVTH